MVLLFNSPVFCVLHVAFAYLDLAFCRMEDQFHLRQCWNLFQAQILRECLN